MPKKLIYAGIGSRNTPDHVLKTMILIASQLAKSNWLLRSGHADGADQAFEIGCIGSLGAKEIFVPWFGFNNAPRDNADYIRPRVTEDLAQFASRYHPNWNACSDAAKLLHMRNCCQILGEHGTEPCDLVICWTKHAMGGGGTGQAIRIALDHNIPVFDLADESNHQKLCAYVLSLETSA